MAKRSGQPALYEMMRGRGPLTVGPDAPRERTPPIAEPEDEIEVMRDDASPSPALDRLVGLLKPGRTVRLPVGYLLLACGGLLLILIVAYVIGVTAGKSLQRAEFHAKFGEGFDLSPRPPAVNDPLTLQPLDATDGAANNPEGGVLSGGGARAASPDSASGARSPADWGPVVPSADPRRKGWNYFIAAETTPAGAKRLAEFCRSHGLETYAVPYKNASRVIVFPGFQGPRDAPAVKALEERMHQVGDLYKAANRHETNMRDAYPAKYDG